MHVGCEDAVISLCADRAVEQRIDGEGIRLNAFISHLRGRLEDIEHRAVEVGKAHRNAGAGEEARRIVDPCGGPEVIVRIEADALLFFDRRLICPIAPRDTVRAFAVLLRQGGEARRKLRQLRGVVGVQLRKREVPTTCIDMHTDFKSLIRVGSGLRCCQCGARVKINAGADALPIGDGTS